jgi:murein DD-endopeptidase MepM/ murein hydrolase activator NlpD
MAKSGGFRPIAAVVALLFPLAALAAERQCRNDVPVCIETEVRGTNTSFVASNATPAPYSFRVVPEKLANLKALVPTPFRAVVPAGETRVIGSLEPIDPKRPSRYAFRWGAELGSLLARPDRHHRYRMPFGGTRHRVLSQGVGGHFSHTGRARYAFDFGMPWGTPVLAARAGVVVQVVDGNVASGARKVYYDKANRVQVLHADGTIAMYAHLRHGAVVEVGDRVATGDLIGLSGDTGFSTGPHLHFMVWKRMPDLSLATVPIRFDDGTRLGFVPGRGVEYPPACSTSGMGCAPGETPPRDEAPPAAPTPRARPAVRRDDGACLCPNGAVLHVDLPCRMVCGR